MIKNIEFFEIPSIKTAFGKRKSSLYVSEKVVGGAKILSYALYFAFEGAEALFVTIIISPLSSISKNNFVILPSVFSMFNCVF